MAGGASRSERTDEAGRPIAVVDLLQIPQPAIVVRRQSFSGRADIDVPGWIVAELVLGEKALTHRRSALRLGDMGRSPAFSHAGSCRPPATPGRTDQTAGTAARTPGIPTGRPSGCRAGSRRCLEVWLQMPQQPDDLDVAVGLHLPAAGSSAPGSVNRRCRASGGRPARSPDAPSPSARRGQTQPPQDPTHPQRHR